MEPSLGPSTLLKDTYLRSCSRDLLWKIFECYCAQETGEKTELPRVAVSEGKVHAYGITFEALDTKEYKDNNFRTR